MLFGDAASFAGEARATAGPSGDAPEGGVDVPGKSSGGAPRPRRLTPVPALPAGIAACLFDLDGVITQTAKVHAAAWKEMFDAFLRDRSGRTGESPSPFALPEDYAAHVDGRLRPDGVRAFLASRGIVLPEGTPDDPPAAET